MMVVIGVIGMIWKFFYYIYEKLLMIRFILALASVLSLTVSCTKNSNRTSGDCNDCKWYLYDRKTKTITQTAGYDDWFNDTLSWHRQVKTYCHFLDTLKIAYPNDTTGSGDSIIYTCH